jgi:hypothetical protein
VDVEIPQQILTHAAKQTGHESNFKKNDRIGAFSKLNLFS